MTFPLYETAGILTKEAVDDAKQATHGADDGRDDVILPLYLQTAGVNVGHACPAHFRAQPGGICHFGYMWEAAVWDKGCGFISGPFGDCKTGGKKRADCSTE